MATALLLSAPFTTIVPANAAKPKHCGEASWYALHSTTASGETMVPSKLTAAHRHLGFGTHIKVVNEDNGRSVTVRINDRGPFVSGRVLDLSRGAARKLGFIGDGIADVCYRIIG
ncbi:septal ring lytic transglycosylase RlpA family protein [Pararhizobium mangrovi]|nr:septal ring lytic transglycosylase RlpA family protein [Pararhizobium mangrovi]